jgi:hypothetical protein
LLLCPAAWRSVQRVRREVTLVDVGAVLLAVGGAIATLAFSFFAFFAFFEGLDWQALVLASGGICLSVWAGLRLSGGRTD